MRYFYSVIKYSILFISISAVVFLGLSSPVFLGPRLDPVPDQLKVAHSTHCAGCHGFDATGNSLVDGEGRDVNIHDDWQFSMMGLSAHDPFWRATLEHEVNLYPEARTAIEETCLKCHAPLGSFQSHLSGHPYSFNDMLNDSLGLDGVSCSSCHQQPAANLGQAHSGNFTLDTNRLLFGPYPNPFQDPMQIYVGFDPVFSDHIYSSGVCAGCHTLITETLDENGVASGNSFIEQATYHEWLNSAFPSQGKECQTCHMPFIKDSVVIATDLLALKKRYPFGLHQFFGANTAMLSMMRDNRSALDIHSSSPDSVWNESIQNNSLSLKQSAVVHITHAQSLNDTLYVDVSISNKAGHKLPSGYPSRVAWLQLILTDAVSNDTIYKNGILDSNGEIAGRDIPYELHHEISYSDDDVQIYEMVMADLGGHLTTRLNGASHPLKDNRLLPLGFRHDHYAYDTVAVWGNANEDIQYTSESNKGKDIIQYRIPLMGRKGTANLEVALNYHTFPSRWMNDLFTNDTLNYVAAFKSMYSGYENFYEIIDTAHIGNLPLSPSATQGVHTGLKVALYPNPGTGDRIHVEFNQEDLSSLNFRLVDIKGRLVHQGQLLEYVKIPSGIKPGIYYFLIYKNGEVIALEPYTLL